MAAKGSSKPQATRAPLTNKQHPSKPSTLSAEYIESSDESSVEEATLAASKEKSIEKEKQPVSNGQSPDSNGAESDPSADSGVVSSHGHGSPIRKEVKGKGRAVQDERANGTEAVSKKSAKKQVRIKEPAQPLPLESEPEEEEEEEEEDVNMEDLVENAPATRNAKPAAPLNTTFKTNFRPPAGFALASIPKSNSLHSQFAKKNLKGKQLWHIVAPSDIPIQSVTSAALLHQQTADSTKGRIDPDRTVVSRHGLDYSFTEATEHDAPRWAYVPAAGTNTYTPVPLRIQRTLRLQHRPGASGTQSLGTIGGDSTGTSARTAPKQPTGLRMRYQPFGIATEDHLSRTLPSTRPDLPSLRMLSPEKRKGSVIEGDDEETPKKHKKPRRDKDQTRHKPINLGSAPVDIASQEAPSVEGFKSPSKNSASNIQHPTGAEEETPAERARRRAEKKQRKEEKLARKAERQARRAATAA